MNALAKDPRRALMQVDHHGKRALQIDLDADDFFISTLYGHLRDVGADFAAAYTRRSMTPDDSIVVIGEESYAKREIDLDAETRPVIINDPIDGTDLLERGLWNWCTAAIAFYPRGEPGDRIIGGFVGVPPGFSYYATCLEPGAFSSLRPHLSEMLTPTRLPNLRRMPSTTSLDSASICFYGQKIDSFFSLANTKLLIELQEAARKHKEASEDIGDHTGVMPAARPKKEFAFRLYNLGGIPMMVKLADRVEGASNIDAVIELRGQQVHDVAPGLYIALKGGAALRHLDGSEFTQVQLEEALLNPRHGRVPYVLAASEALADLICEGIRPITGSPEGPERAQRGA